MRVEAAVVVAVALLSACSSRPSFHTDATVGRIVSASENDGGTSGPVSIPLIVPTAPVLANISIEYTKTSSRFYIYTIREASGRVVQTQSLRRFPVGNCIRLWHAPQAASDGQSHEHNFVAGTLEESNECSS